MSASVLVWVRPLSPKESAASGRQVNRALDLAGMKQVRCRAVTPVYCLEGDQLSRMDVSAISEKLLCDPVLEKPAVNAAPPGRRTLFLDVWYRPGVTDTVAESISKAVKDLEIETLERSRAGTRYEFECKPSAAGGTKSLAQKLAAFANAELLNPLVQECKILP